MKDTHITYFEEIYKEHYQRIFLFIQKLCGDEHLAEELSQETFLQAYKGLHKFRGECEIFTWLAAIAKHTYYKHLRKNKLGIETINLDYMTETYFVSSLGSPEDELKRKSVTEVVQKMLKTIPEKYRDVVILRIYGDMPFSQVAAALDITENSAKVIFFRAKKMLMEELQNEFEL